MSPAIPAPAGLLRQHMPQLSIDTPKMDMSQPNSDGALPTPLPFPKDISMGRDIDPTMAPHQSPKQTEDRVEEGAFRGDIFGDSRRIRALKRAVGFAAPRKERVEGDNNRQVPISILCEKIVAEFQTEYPGLDGVVARVFATIKYLVDCAVFSGYTLKSRERLAIFVFLCGRGWRCHDVQLFRYSRGVWQRWGEILDFAAHEELIATDGVFTPSQIRSWIGASLARRLP